MAREVMAREHYVIERGLDGPELVKKDGAYLIDDGPVFTGLEIIRKQMETALKFLPGVASATKVQVITDDDIADALEAERADLDQLESGGQAGGD